MSRLILKHLNYTWLSIFSALLLSLSLPNPVFLEGLGFLGFTLLIPLLVSLYSVKLLRWHLFYTFIFGFVYCLTSNFWLFFYKDFAWTTLGPGSFVVALITMILGVYTFLFRNFKPHLRPFFIAITWSFYEIGKSNGFFGFPWGLLSHTPHKMTLLTQILDLVGPAGLTFIILLPNAFLAEFICSPYQSEKKNKQWQITYPLFYLILIIFSLSYGTIALLSQDKNSADTSTISLLLVQQNTNPWAEKVHDLIAYQKTVSHKFEKNPGKKFDLIVGSEGILPYTYNTDNGVLNKHSTTEEFFDDPGKKFKPFLKKINIPQLLGGVTSDSKGHKNSALLLAPSGKVLQYYEKRQLVPFAEYNPLLKFPWVYWFFDNVIHYPFTWTPGKMSTLFQLTLLDNGRVIHFGTPICFEDAFGWVSRDLTQKGANILINLTNDSWSRVVTIEMQHLIAAKYRTIENRRPLVRATTSGMTAHIDIFGRIIASLTPFTQDSLEVHVKIPKKLRTTLYTLSGNWLAISFFIFVHIYLLWIHYSRKKHKILQNHAK